MSDNKFVHLYVHTDYSMCDGLMDVKKVVSNAKSLGMEAVSITDFMNQCNAVKLYECGMGQGVKPIFGIELNVYDDTKKNAAEHTFFRIKLYAINLTGYRNIVDLQSYGYQQGALDHVFRVNLSWLKDYSDGVIMLTGGLNGDLAKFLLSERQDLFEQRLKYYRECYPNRLYFEISRCGRPQEEEYIALALKKSVEENIPVVATNPVMFAKKEDFEIHRVRVAIQDKVTIHDEKWVHPYTDQMYMRSPEEMIELFSDIPEAIENTWQIARRCNVELSLGTNYLPKFPTGDLTDAEYLRKEAYEGLEERLAVIFPDEEERNKNRPRYLERLEIELDVIIKMDFPGYFLIVMDFIQWSKKNNIPVGPGRGSGAGSLVAYAIKITDFDPLPYDLLFERFLNPERVSMPDFDVDFCMDNRGEVIKYVASKYGRTSVSQIITFGTLAAKASVKSVCRVLGKSYSFGDNLSKLILSKPDVTLKATLGLDPKKEEYRIQEFVDKYENDEEYHYIIDIALKLEGITTSHGKHAGGVVISPTVITDFAPLMCDEEGGDFKTQFDKHDVEEAGLVKFDFLGLRTLTVIHWAVDMINARLAKNNQPPVNINRIDLKDELSFELLRSAETTAVFQLESNGMRELIKKMQPDCFEDMIALVALYRPGPLGSGMVDNFVDRKRGNEPIAYPHPDFQHEDLKPVLGPTYGIIVYQEQVMQIAQVLAGYSLGGADILRRAMGKKQPEVMAKHRITYSEGVQKKGIISVDKAMKIFDQVEKFAMYGFNKSHSAAYALVTLQTLWLKAHYPAEFMAAMMSSEKTNAEKIEVFVNECRRLKIKVDPPDINEGQTSFIVNDEGHIVFSLSAVKGVGDFPVEAIMKERSKGPFVSLFDLCRRVDNRNLSKRVLEALIKAGALDKIGPNKSPKDRSTLLKTVDLALNLCNSTSKEKQGGYIDMFADVADEFKDPDYQFTKPFSDKELLQGEVEYLGLYLPIDPLSRYLDEIDYLQVSKIGTLVPSYGGYASDRPTATVAGILIEVKRSVTSKGDHLMSGVIMDNTGRMVFTLWRDQIARFEDKLELNTLVIVTGKIGYDDRENMKKIFIDKVENITTARQRSAKSLRVYMDTEQLKDQKIAGRIREIAEGQGGNTRLELAIDNDRSFMIIPTQYYVIPSDSIIDSLEYYVKNRVEIIYD